MKSRTKILIILILLASAVLLNAGGFERKGVTKSFSVNKGSNISIDISQSNIRIDCWNKDEVLVRLDGEGNDEDIEYYFNFSQKNNTLSITSDSRNGWDYGADIRITVPQKINLNIKSNFGDTQVKDDITGNVKITSNGGEIKTTSINGEFIAYTAGGDIRAGDVTGKVNAKTNGGELSFGVLSGSPINLETMGGDIRVKKATKQIDLNTMGGDVNIGDVLGGGRLTTNGGDIITGEIYGTVKLKTLGGDIVVKGGKGIINAESNGGDIRLNNIVGSVDTKTMAGDVRVELTPQGDNKNTIKSSYGDVYLYVPSNAKVTIDARIRGYNSYDEDSGDITSDFESSISISNKKNTSLNKVYELNGGGTKINVEANNSIISIKKLRK